MSVIGLVGLTTSENSNILSVCNKYELLELVPDNYKLIEKPMDALLSRLLCFWKNNSFIGYLNNLYAATNTSKFKAIIVKISDWHKLADIYYSYIQISKVNIIFILESITESEEEEFDRFIKKIGRFPTLHFCFCETKLDASVFNKYFNLHDLTKENLLDIIEHRFNNRRKNIGIKYRFDRIAQQVKFNFDLICCCCRIKFFNPYEQQYDNTKKIPKIIHYCWFGKGKYPGLVEKCISTWKKILPDYEIKCWNEDNFPFERYSFSKEALENKKWAFVSDVARLHALYYEGGIYLDTDIEMLKSLDGFLNDGAFTSYESQNLLATGLMGAKPFHPVIAEMLVWYSSVHCDDNYVEIANTKIITKLIKWLYQVKLKGQETILSNGFHVYARDYFSPPLIGKNEWKTTGNTYCIHHFTGMW